MTDWRRWILGAWTVLVLATGVAAVVDHEQRPTDEAVAARAAPATLPSTAPAPSGPPATPGPPVAPAPPVAVEAPAIGLSAPLVPVGKTADGALDVPDFGTAGWYQHSATPAAPGSAVLAGHLDSTTGPDVFFGLAELRPGDEVIVHHEDGSRSVFVVHHGEITDKDALPVERIFDDPVTPELRLITCGGGFDRSARSYDSNVIVYAHLVSRAT